MKDKKQAYKIWGWLCPKCGASVSLSQDHKCPRDNIWRRQADADYLLLLKRVEKKNE